MSTQSRRSRVCGAPSGDARVLTPTVASLSDYFTLMATGFALISDGYQNNLATVLNPIFTKLYPAIYTASVKTRVSNSLLVGGKWGNRVGPGVGSGW